MNIAVAVSGVHPAKALRIAVNNAVRRPRRYLGDSPNKLTSVHHREHGCMEIGNPLLALVRDAKVAQGISDIRPDRLPEEIWIVSSQI